MGKSKQCSSDTVIFIVSEQFLNGTSAQCRLFSAMPLKVEKGTIFRASAWKKTNELQYKRKAYMELYKWISLKNRKDIIIIIFIVPENIYGIDLWERCLNLLILSAVKYFVSGDNSLRCYYGRPPASWPMAIIFYCWCFYPLTFFSPANLGGLWADRHQTVPHVRWRPTVMFKIESEIWGPSPKKFGGPKASKY